MTDEQTTKKKGLSPLAWIGIGCGVLILIAFFVMSAGLWFGGRMVKNVAEDFQEDPARSAAELIVKMNPNLELVETDKDEGTITVREKDTGEVATFDYSQIQEGKLSFESAEGKMTFNAQGAAEEGGIITMETDEGTATWGAGEAADWVPEYPNAEELQVLFSQDMSEGSGGAVSFSTKDSPKDVLAFFTNELQSDGFTVRENTSMESGEMVTAILAATDESTQRQAQITVTPEAGVVRVVISYGAGN